MMNELPEVGKVYSTPFPFVRCIGSDMDVDGVVTFLSWRPGHEYRRMDDWGKAYADCDGIGEVRFTVVDVHKPGKFPTRVFFTRRFVDPNGKEFGKGKLHITTVEKFRRISTRYALDYSVRKCEPNEPSVRELLAATK